MLFVSNFECLFNVGGLRREIFDSLQWILYHSRESFLLYNMHEEANFILLEHFWVSVVGKMVHIFLKDGEIQVRWMHLGFKNFSPFFSDNAREGLKEVAARLVISARQKVVGYPHYK